LFWEDKKHGCVLNEPSVKFVVLDISEKERDNNFAVFKPNN
jgi:hypothetical protein